MTARRHLRSDGLLHRCSETPANVVAKRPDPEHAVRPAKVEARSASQKRQPSIGSCGERGKARGERGSTQGDACPQQQQREVNGMLL
jgi:hypothetical protein